MNKIINIRNLKKNLKSFLNNKPFNHCVIDNFFELKIAKKLEKEFPNYESNIWQGYNNQIEVKKVCNNWNLFPNTTYKVVTYLNSEKFISILNAVISKKKFYPDIGLNGGGWHIHKQGGKLNTHLDYSIHPKLNLQRKLNLIVYLNSKWQKSWGGDLGLWDNKSSKSPGKLIKSVAPIFNRAILFDTTQNSWHGLPEPLTCPPNQFRKSLAIYYLCKKSKKISNRGKALFSPTEKQKGNKSIIKLIKLRSSIKYAHKVYSNQSISTKKIIKSY